MNTTYTSHVILFRLCPSHVAMLAEVGGNCQSFRVPEGLCGHGASGNEARRK